jgi:hypothetical protein
MSDQVPELRYAQLPPLAGTAATADPVSCEHDAMTSTVVGRPVSVARLFFKGPSFVPLAQTGAKICSGRPSAVKIFFD